jgi:hypothetical protein
MLVYLVNQEESVKSSDPLVVSWKFKRASKEIEEFRAKREYKAHMVILEVKVYLVIEVKQEAREKRVSEVLLVEEDHLVSEDLMATTDKRVNVEMKEGKELQDSTV